MDKVDGSAGKLVPMLWYDRGEARRAAEFYASVFPDSHVGDGNATPADNPGTRAGEEQVVAFTVCGQRFIGLNGGDMFRPNEAVSFTVYTDDQAETDRYWDAIVGNGGEERACGWCRDRWGFFWQITPRALMAGMADPDRTAAARVAEAMYAMRRIDIAAIEAAQRGEARDA